MTEFLTQLPIWVNFIFFGIGVLILVKGSDFFIDSSVYFARKFHISEVVIGLTLVSLGTSLPELAANINSALKGRSAIAIGNVTGSNITNIALIIGISALIMGRIKVPKKLFQLDMIIMMITSALLLVFAYFFDKPYAINRIEALIMLVFLIAYMFFLFKFHKKEIPASTVEDKELWIKSMTIAILVFLAGFICIFSGSEVMIRNIIIIADKMEISDGVIGATIVALATSLPELAVTLIGIVKKNAGLSLGNIVGSNILNILGVLGITGLIAPIAIVNHDMTPDIKMLTITLPLTLLVAFLLFVMMSIKMQLGRIKGIIFLLFYIGFIFINFVH